MKKRYFVLLMLGIMFLFITGCGKNSDEVYTFTGKVIEVSSTNIIVEPDEGESIGKSSDEFIIMIKDDIVYELGDRVKVTYNGWMNYSDPPQIYPTKIEKISGSNLEFRVKRYEQYDLIKYNLYYKHSEVNMNGEDVVRNIFFAGDIEEFYVDDISLKDYVTSSYQTFDDSIKSITDKLLKTDMLKDGGTTFYKSKDLDLTVTVCNTIAGNRDIYFNSYDSEYENTMCN